MMKHKIFTTLIFLVLLNSFTKAQDSSIYEKHFFVQGTDTLPYRLLLPLDYNAKKKYPLIIFLHGSGERGNDNKAQLFHGGSLFVRDSLRKNYPAIVVFPQCPANSFWSNVNMVTDTATDKTTFIFGTGGEPTLGMKLLLMLIDDLQDNYRLNNKQLYVGGLSMGGMGTFEITRRMPGKFAAAFAICGGADTTTAKQITQPAWWIFHGLKDDVVNPEFSKNMSAALKNAGADVQITLYPNDGHDSWDDAFKEPKLFSWLFSHHK